MPRHTRAPLPKDAISRWLTEIRLLSQIFKLLNEAHIEPISPCQIFPFDQIASAFRYMHGGNHIGKVVISDGPKRDVQVPVCLQISAAMLKLNRFDRRSLVSEFGQTRPTL